MFPRQWENISRSCVWCFSGSGRWVSVSTVNLQRQFPPIKQPARQEKLIPAQQVFDRRVVFMEQHSYTDSTLLRAAGTFCWRSDFSLQWTARNTLTAERQFNDIKGDFSRNSTCSGSFPHIRAVSSLSSSQLIIYWTIDLRTLLITCKSAPCSFIEIQTQISILIISMRY